MPRRIKGWEFVEKIRDGWETYKAIKLYVGLYGQDQVKVHNMVNQFGAPYTNIYIKKDAKPIRELKAKFGSYMSFETPEEKKTKKKT